MIRTLSSLFQALQSAGLVRGLAAVPDSLDVLKIAHDTKEVVPGTLFVCIRGAKSDGHTFLPEAIARGACAAIVEEAVPGLREQKVPAIVVSDARAALAVLAETFFSSPSRGLTMIGVTGTNGKTSTSWLIARMLSSLGVSCAYGGTFGLARPELLEGSGADQYAQLGTFQRTKNASPDPVVMQEFLARLLSQGAKACALEATSQGVAQKRTKGIHWDAMTFTNLTRDHLDLHGTMENYFEMKAELFTAELARSSKALRTAVINADDPWGQKLLARMEPFSNVRVLRYSRERTDVECFVRDAELSLRGTRIECVLEGEAAVLNSRLIGRYNVENILAAVATVAGIGHSLQNVAAILPDLPPVPGRMEMVSAAADDVTVVVDYAHTPDGLIQVQESLRPLCTGKLITVFGCGGDRDRGKRPLMARAVGERSDAAVVTSDNPRSENPEAIIQEILPGFDEIGGRRECRISVEPDRRKAIELAVRSAQPGDTILVAGKGHEDYQEVAGTRHPFLDGAVSREALRLRGAL